MKMENDHVLLRLGDAEFTINASCHEQSATAAENRSILHERTYTLYRRAL